MRISTLATALVVATIGFSALAATSTVNSTTTTTTAPAIAAPVAPAAATTTTTTNTTSTSTLTASQKADIEKTCRDTNKSNDTAYKACVSAKEAAK